MEDLGERVGLCACVLVCCSKSGTIESPLLPPSSHPFSLPFPLYKDEAASLSFVNVFCHF